MTKQTTTYDFNTVPPGALRDLVTASITVFIIEDTEYHDTYKIQAQRTNLGLEILCSLNGCPSYQADDQNAGYTTLRKIVNTIAGGKVL